MTGKTVIVTGATAGLGLETCLQLAKRDAHVFCVGRNEQKLQEVVESIKSSTGNSKVEYLVADFLDLVSVEKAADQFLGRKLKLNVLVNNAGIMHPPFSLSKQGIESQFATNHFATAVFTQKLIPTLADKSRIVNLSSIAHYPVKENGIVYDKLNDESNYNPQARYSETKLANIHYTTFLQQKLTDSGKDVYVNCCHPGVVKTQLFKNESTVVHALSNLLFINTQKGALTQIYLAGDESIEKENYRGQYFETYCSLEEPSFAATNKDFVKRTAEWTQEILRSKFRADWSW